MTDVAVIIPKELMEKVRRAVAGNSTEFDDQSLILWVIENYLDTTDLAG